MPDPDELLRIRIVNRNDTVLGWLQERPQTPAWKLGPEPTAGAWPRARAAALCAEYQRGQAWRGRRPQLVPTATGAGDTAGMVALESPDGAWRVEPIQLDQGDGPRLRYRITRHGTHVATVATVDEVAAHVDLAALHEDDGPSDHCPDAEDRG